MNAHYSFPNTFDASSPDSLSLSPPASVSSDFTLSHNAPSPEYSSEFDMLQQHSQHSQQPHNYPHNTHSSHPYAVPHAYSSSPGSSGVTDFDFASSLRAVRGTRDASRGEDAEQRSVDGPTESEAAVAETIVRARKSWKTVKGRSEPVWPPHLEKALVQALLQYKPHDSRYARALGRFPKRNRYISDFIFAATGVRRSPKQVGSRLQQLKDVSCGKMLLNHVASWSLAPSGNDSTISPSNLHPNLSDIIGDASGQGSEGSPSPISPHSGARDSSLTGVSLKPYNTDSALFPGSRVQARGGYTGSSAPSPPFDSPPLTPTARSMNVFVPFDPANTGIGSNSAGSRQQEEGERPRPLVRFGGCLARPETVYAQELPDSQRTTSGRIEPRATFVARDPIAAQSVARVWIEGSSVSSSSSVTVLSSNLTPLPSLMQGKRESGHGARVQVHEHSEPLVCMQTPAAHVSSAQTSFYSVDKFTPGRGAAQGRGFGSQAEEDSNCFVYATRLVDDSMWRAMRREGGGLSRYTITQDLMHSFDSPSTTRGETFLSITYHFVPISQYTVHLSAPSTLSPLDVRGIACARGRAHDSVSPASSSSSSPVSVSPSSLVHASLHAQQATRMHSLAQGTYSAHGHVYAQPQASRRVPQLSVQPPPPSVSQTGALMSAFDHNTNCGSVGNPASEPFSGYGIDFGGLDMDTLNLSANVGLDRPLL